MRQTRRSRDKNYAKATAIMCPMYCALLALRRKQTLSSTSVSGGVYDAEMLA